MNRLIAMVVISLGLVVAGCGDAGGQAAPATAAPAATSAPASSPTAAAAAASPTAASVTAAQGATASPASAATAAVRATATPAANPAARSTSDTTRIVFAEGTEARYRVREQLANRSLPNDAVGTTQDVTGAIVFGPDGKIVAEQSKITVDLTTLKSDEGRRDRYIQRSTLQTSTYPTAEFVPKEVRGITWPLPASGQATFEMIGDLTIHGVTRPATWQTEVQFADEAVTGTAHTNVKITDFGMELPRVATVLSIEDDARLEIDVKGQRE